MGGLQRAESLGQTLRCLVKLPVKMVGSKIYEKYWIQRKLEVEKFGSFFFGGGDEHFLVWFQFFCRFWIQFVLNSGLGMNIFVEGGWE